MKSLVLFFLAVTSFTIVWCTTIQYTQSVRWDWIQYDYISSYQYTLPANEIPRADSGTLVKVYSIKDKKLWIDIEHYNFYQIAPKPYNIKNGVKHEYYDNQPFLTISEWWRWLTKIPLPDNHMINDTESMLSFLQNTNRKFLSEKCALTWGVPMWWEYNRFKSNRYVMLGMDSTSVGSNDQPIDCPFMIDIMQFPKFIFDKQNTGSILVAVVPEWIAWVSDYSRINTLER